MIRNTSGAAAVEYALTAAAIGIAAVVAGSGIGSAVLDHFNAKQQALAEAGGPAVNLIGLVKHAEPVVYLTGKAKDPKEVKTREPDDFEASALDALRNGEDLKAEKEGTKMRAVGPIYAGKRCTACHERGLFLGAFSYRLELAAAPKDADAAPIFPPLAP